MTDFLAISDGLLRRARITIPRQGAWTADVEFLEAPSETSGQVTIIFGSQSLVGTIYRQTDQLAPGFDTRIVGGAGGLSTPLGAQHYRQAQASIFIDDAMSAGGETLSSTSSSTATGTIYGSWVRPVRTVGQELDAIARNQSIEWRVLLDGTIFLGSSAWATVTLDDVEIFESLSDGRMLIGSEDPVILPGQVFEGGRVSTVIHHIEESSVRTELFFEDATSDVSRLHGMLDQYIRRAQNLDHMPGYEYQVVKQNGNGTLDLKTIDQRLPDLQNVPIRFGLPGVTADVSSGHRVLVNFAGGNELDPGVVGWLSGTPTNMAFSVSGLLQMGDDPAADFVALATVVDNNFALLDTLLNNWVVVPADGGAALQTAAGVLAATGWPFTTAASKLRAT